MCGRFTLHTPEPLVRESLLPESAGSPASGQLLRPRFNIAPSQEVAIVRDTGAGRELVMARWGLVPHWSKTPQTGYSTINARIESVAEKPAFRTAFRRRRCLIPADGFYEWRQVNGAKLPQYILLRDGGVFAFAGLWDRWEGDGKSLDSCSIIVMPASEQLRALHDRMPVIVHPAQYDGWLDSAVTSKPEILRLLESERSGELVSYPVSTWVNSPAHDDSRCMQAEPAP
ncbi:MAG TPA: SOS response-associated peptidase [Gammaproteobacteria bacterium]|nr:SOS response-associated peptidase [Gammaproteobacteria bacterium]